METHRFFGFGSLVNRATHSYPEGQIAQLGGWRREWVSTRVQRLCFLSARPDPNTEIAGLMASVPGGDWAALDLRETYYARHPIKVRAGQENHAAQVYAVEEHLHAGDRAEAPILLSYLDVVIQGYLREFGETGVADFIATTDGWDAPVLDDRSAPLYPRAQVLNPNETLLVDAHLQALGCRILPLGSVEI